MTRSSFRRVIALTALLPLGGCPLFSVSAEIPEMCVGFHDRLIAGVKPGGSFERKIVADPLSSFGAYLSLGADITDAKATIHAKSGVANLAFIDSISVSLAGADTTNPMAPISLVDCIDYACASDTMDATLTNTPPEGVLDLLASGKVQIELTLTGDLPENDWVVDLEVCISGSVHAALEL
jgi:hypothetical protein